MRRKMRKKINPLPFALCVAAVIIGIWAGLVRGVLSRLKAERNLPPHDGVEIQVEPIQAVTVQPVSEPKKEAEGTKSVKAMESPKPEPHASATVKPQSPPKAAEKAKRPTPRPAVQAVAKEPDLSAYKVKAIRADRSSYLPEDTSLSVRDLNQQRQKPEEKKDPFAGKKGLVGDVYRGAKRFIDSVDAATLNASRKALGSVAQPDKATLRPSGGGVRLHLEIPPETVKIGR